jgi:WD40 repeat protein/uncharacterized caspase-like protein
MDNQRRFIRIQKEVVWTVSALSLLLFGSLLVFQRTYASGRDTLAHKGRVQSVAFSPDGRRMISGSDDWTFKLWDVQTGDLVRTYPDHLDMAVPVAVFSPDGKLVVSGSGAKSKLWDLETGATIQIFAGDGWTVKQVAFAPNSRWVLSVGWSTTLWNLAGEPKHLSRRDSYGPTFGAAFSPDSRQVACAMRDGVVEVWDVETGEVPRFLEGHRGAVKAVAFSRDGKQIFSGGSDKTLRLWNVETGSTVRTFNGHLCEVISLAVSPDGIRAASGSAGGLRMWDVKSGAMLWDFVKSGGEGTACSRDCGREPDPSDFMDRGRKQRYIHMQQQAQQVVADYRMAHKQWLDCVSPAESANSLAFSPDGRTLLSGWSDARARLFDVQTGALLHVFDGSRRGSRAAGQPSAAGTSEPVQNVRLVPQLGHTEPAVSAAISPDGRRVISAAGEIKLWDVETGSLLRTFGGGEGVVHAVRFLPDGRRALSGSYGGTLTVWDTATGNPLRTIRAHQKGVHSIGISPDGRRALSVGFDPSASTRVTASTRVWDLESGVMLRTLEGNQYVSAVSVFFPDGRRVLSGDSDQKARIWDVATGAITGTLKGEISQFPALAISRDGRRALSGGGEEMKLWDLETGALTRTFSGPFPPPDCVAFSPDGRQALAGSGAVTTVWDVATGNLVQKLDMPYSSVKYCQFSPDGQRVLLDAHGVKLWNRQTGAVHAFVGQGHFLFATEAVFSPDEKRILSGAVNGEIGIWDLETGAFQRGFGGHREEANVAAVAFSRDGRQALAQSGKGSVLWNVEAGTGVRTFEWPRGMRPFLLLSPDGQLAVSGQGNKVEVWNLETNAPSQTLLGHVDRVGTATFCPDGRLLTGSSDKTVKLWDIRTGTTSPLGTLRGHTAAVSSLACSADSRQVLSGSRDIFGNGDGLKLWNVGSAVPTRSFGESTPPVTTVAISPNGRSALSAHVDYSIRSWNLATGKPERVLTGHTSHINSVIYSASGKYALSTSHDGTMRLWRLDTGDSMIMVNAGPEWLTYTDDGYFDSSRNGGAMVTAVQGDRAFHIDQLAVRNNRPDIILERMGLGSPGLIAHYRAWHEKRLRKLKLKDEQLAARFDKAPTARIVDAVQKKKSVDLVFDLATGDSVLSRYDIFVNNVPMFGGGGKSVTGRQQRITDRIALAAGRNKVEVAAMNAAGAESLRDFRVFDYDEKAPGDLYFLGFGVSRYEDSRLNLKYAHQDVLDLAELLKKARGHFKEVHVATYVNRQVVRTAIRDAKAFFSKAKVDDTVVLFVAGHGIHSRDVAGEYFYLTHDTDVNRLAETAVNFDSIEALLDGIAPRRKLFFMDTCESGDREEGEEQVLLAQAGQRGLQARTVRGIVLASTGGQVKATPRKYLFDRERFIYNDIARRTGAIVFSSSRGSEASFERDDLQNGVFTEEILFALSTDAADKDKDGLVTTDELREYVGAAVARRTGDMQHPTVDRDNLEARVALPVLK